MSSKLFTKIRKEKLALIWKEQYSTMKPEIWGGQVYKCVALGYFAALGCSFDQAWEMCHYCKI